MTEKGVFCGEEKKEAEFDNTQKNKAKVEGARNEHFIKSYGITDELTAKQKNKCASLLQDNNVHSISFP